MNFYDLFVSSLFIFVYFSFIKTHQMQAIYPKKRWIHMHTSIIIEGGIMTVVGMLIFGWWFTVFALLCLFDLMTPVATLYLNSMKSNATEYILILDTRQNMTNNFLIGISIYDLVWKYNIQKFIFFFPFLYF